MCHIKWSFFVYIENKRRKLYVLDAKVRPKKRRGNEQSKNQDILQNRLKVSIYFLADHHLLSFSPA